MDELKPDPTQLKLNVVFHGPFLFIYYPNRVEVVTPNTPEHVVVAGNWLGEKLCHPGTFHLTGIKAQDPFDPSKDVKADQHAIVNGQGKKIDIEQGPYYRFILPFLPSYEIALAPAQIDPTKIFVGDYAGYVRPTSFGTVHVLSYKIKSDETPQLEGLQWMPQLTPYPGKTKECKSFKYSYSKNLHIYAEAAFEPDPSHPVRDFKRMVTMLPGLSLGLAQQLPKLNFPDPENNDQYGILREEQGGLRGLPPRYDPEFMPPLVCDAPSLVVIGAQDPAP